MYKITYMYTESVVLYKKFIYIQYSIYIEEYSIAFYIYLVVQASHYG